MCATKEVERKNGEDTEDLRQPRTHGPITVVWRLFAGGGAVFNDVTGHINVKEIY